MYAILQEILNINIFTVLVSEIELNIEWIIQYKASITILVLN